MTGLVITAALMAFVLIYFQPQDLFLNHAVNEPLPRPAPAADAASVEAGGRGVAVSFGATGEFRSGEHHTSGRAQLVDVPGRGTYLRLSRFRTSNGPAVHVWLSASDGSSNGAINRSSHVDLGVLKGNIGNQNYLVPPEASGEPLRLVVVWCERFHVAFGTASLS